MENLVLFRAFLGLTFTKTVLLGFDTVSYLFAFEILSYFSFVKVLSLVFVHLFDFVFVFVFF